MKKGIGLLMAIFVVASGVLAVREWSLLPDGKMHAAILTVGQGDSTLITFRSGQRMLIDGGPDWSTLSELGRRLPFFDREIDIVLLTHPNADHMVSLPDIVRRYHVKTLMTAGASYDGDLYRSLLSGADLAHVRRQVVHAGDTLRIDTATLHILWPPAKRIPEMDRDLNNDSIVLRLDEGGRRILFTGDMEGIVEKTLLASGVDLTSDVLKVAHHGSNTSSTEAFLRAVHPLIAVISVGRENPYRHPDARVLRRLGALDIPVWRTDTQGSYEDVW